jgi:hypothetical protein
MSVTDAPLARMALNAACPGVSRNVAVACSYTHPPRHPLPRQELCTRQLRAQEAQHKKGWAIGDFKRGSGMTGTP